MIIILILRIIIIINKTVLLPSIKVHVHSPRKDSTR